MSGHERRRGRRAIPGVAGVWLALALVAATTVSAEGSAPTVSPEYPVSEVAVGGARFDQQSPSVASDGSTYLVAWAHLYRTGRGDRGHIRAARLGPDGTPVDPFGFQLSDGQYADRAPSVAWNNGVYLVVWEQEMPEWTMPCCFPDLVKEVYGARVSPDGTVLDPGGFPIAQVAGSDQQSPDVAPLGDGFLVVWQDGRADNPGIRAARVSTGGAVVDPDGIDISTDAGGGGAAVAGKGDTALVVWSDARAGNADVHGARVGADGALLDPSGFPITTGAADERHAAVASNGTDFLVGWEVHGTERPDIHASRVTADATVLDPGGMLVAEDATEAMAVTIASAGSGYLVAWTDIDPDRANEVRGQHVAPNGTTSTPTSFPIGISGYNQPGASAGPGGYLVTWSAIGNQWDVFAKPVPASGQPADTNRILVSGEPNEQLEPAAAWDGTNYLVVWTDHRSGSDVYASRVRPDGTNLDGTGIPISTAHNSQRDAQVAWNGSTYLVVWIDYRSQDPELYGARVTPKGDVLDPDGIRLAPPGSSPSFDLSVASDGSGFVVAWIGRSGEPPVYGVHATRVAADGTVLDPQPIFLGPNGRAPGVAWNGRTYLVAWSSDAADDRDIHAVRIMRGRVRDRTPIVVSSAPGWQVDAQVSSDGDGFFVAWTDRRSGGGSFYESNADVYGARVRKNGTVLDPEGVAVASGPEDEYATGAVWNGRNHVVSWRTRSANPINLSRVTADAVVMDPAGIPAGSGYSTSLVAGPPAEAAIVTDRYLPDPPYNGVARAFIRFFRE